MSPTPRKVCVLGRGGAGKTTLALRIAGCSDESGALARAAWRVLEASVGEPPTPIRLFDGPGRARLDSLGQPLLMRSHAWLLVADGSDPDSVAGVVPLYTAACTAVEPRPVLVLVNKCDLPQEAAPGDLAALAQLGPVHHVSARTGAGLDAALVALARLLHPG